MPCSVLAKPDQRTWTASNIVECKLCDPRIELHQEGERLANASASAEDCDLSRLKAHGVSVCLQLQYGEMGSSSVPVERRPKKLDAAGS